MAKIFISYRRDDAGEAAGRLSDNLMQHFVGDGVFMDVDGIALGRDFRKVIEDTLDECGVMLAVIGKSWLQSLDAKGNRRLDQPGDFVRLEIGTALKRDIPVVPVCVQGAGVPGPDDLPDDLKNLAFRNAFELTHARWNSDVQLLIEKLRLLMGEPAAKAQTASVPDVRPKPLVSAIPIPATKKKSSKQIAKWCLVGFFVLLILGLGSEGKDTLLGGLVLFGLPAIFFFWDPFNWFVEKS